MSRSRENWIAAHSQRVYQLLSFLSFFFIHFSIPAAPMTKRDSNTANLLSPRDLRMESYEVDMPTVAPNSYVTENPSTPGPDSHPQASSSHIHPMNQMDPSHSRQLPHVVQPGEYRQRVGHSTVFKVIQEAQTSGRLSSYIVVEETDSTGYLKKKSLEKYFFGIIGDLRDRWGYKLDSHTLCSQLANYWRTWFGVPTEGATFEPYSDTYHEAPDVTPEPVPAPATTDTPTSEIPEQILQVAWFLMALINEHPDPNQGLLREIQQQPIGQLRDLRTDRVDHAALATLCADLGIAASYLSRQQAANQEMVI